MYYNVNDSIYINSRPCAADDGGNKRGNCAACVAVRTRQGGITMKMIISVAEYVKDIEVREVVRRSDNIRSRTFEICYCIPGYADLPRKVQNAVYDKVKLMIENEANRRYA